MQLFLTVLLIVFLHALKGVAAQKSAAQLAAERQREELKSRWEAQRQQRNESNSYSTPFISQEPRESIPTAMSAPNVTRFRELCIQESARFKAPNMGDQIILYLKAGGSHKGRITGLTEQHVIVDSITYSAKMLTQETCAQLFEVYYGYQRAQELLQQEQTGKVDLFKTATSPEITLPKNGPVAAKPGKLPGNEETVSAANTATLVDFAGCWVANGDFAPPKGYPSNVHSIHIRLDADGKGACFLNATTPPSLELSRLLSPLDSQTPTIAPQGVVKGSAVVDRRGTGFFGRFAGINDGSTVSVLISEDKTRLTLTFSDQSVVLSRDK